MTYWPEVAQLSEVFKSRIKWFVKYDGVFFFHTNDAEVHWLDNSMKWIGGGELQEVPELRGLDVTFIYYTGYYGAALTRDGDLYLWKCNNVQPKLVNYLPEKVTKVTGGDKFIVVLTVSQHIWFWGKNNVRALIATKHVRPADVERPIMLSGEYIDVDAANNLVAAIDRKQRANVWCLDKKPSKCVVADKFKSVSIGLVSSEDELMPYAIFLPESTNRCAGGRVICAYREDKEWVKTDLEIGGNLKISNIYANRSNTSVFAVCTNGKLYEWKGVNTNIFNRNIPKKAAMLSGSVLADVANSIPTPIGV